MKYLPLYYKWMKDGELPLTGLCDSLDTRNLFDPPYKHPYYGNAWYWGYNGKPYDDWDMIPPRQQYKIEYEFTPLRQNIVLFLAAMNGEL